MTLPALTASDLACQVASDCAFTLEGTVCSTDCGCGRVAANTAAANRIAAELATHTNDCGCLSDQVLECLEGVCTAVVPSFDAGPPTDFDGGPVPIVFDAGPAPFSDASTTCVDLDPSTYDTSCETSADCTNLQLGQICNGDCPCFGSPVNVDNTAQWTEATSGITWSECECPAEATPLCVAGQCVAGGSPGSGTGN